MMQDISSDEQKSLTVDRPLLPSQLHFQLAALLLMHFIIHFTQLNYSVSPVTAHLVALSSGITVAMEHPESTSSVSCSHYFSF